MGRGLLELKGRPNHPEWSPRATLAAEPARGSAAPGSVWREGARVSVHVGWVGGGLCGDGGGAAWGGRVSVPVCFRALNEFWAVIPGAGRPALT